MGTDIHTENDYVIRCPSLNGYVKVIEFLIEKDFNVHVKGGSRFYMVL